MSNFRIRVWKYLEFLTAVLVAFIRKISGQKSDSEMCISHRFSVASRLHFKRTLLAMPTSFWFSLYIRCFLVVMLFFFYQNMTLPSWLDPVHQVCLAQNSIYFQQANSFTKDKDFSLLKMLLRIVPQAVMATFQD